MNNYKDNLINIIQKDINDIITKYKKEGEL